MKELFLFLLLNKLEDVSIEINIFARTLLANLYQETKLKTMFVAWKNNLRSRLRKG